MHYKRSLIILSALLLAGFVFGEEIIDPDTKGVHDPSMIYSDNYFYVYSTGSRISMRRSADLHNWEYLGRVFSEIPQWVKNKIPGIPDLWAPDITYHNGKYYLCYSGSTFGTNTSTMGLVSNLTLDPASPNYAWVDEGEIISSTSSNNYNTIDGTFVRDHTGQMWLVFGSYWTGIKLTPLDQATLKPDTTPATLYSIASRPSTSIEAAYIYYRDGYYYLFVNFDSCCQGVDSTYKIMVGRSTTITGPYYDKDGDSMMDGGGTLFIDGGSRWKGPGHATITTLNDQDFFSFHAYDALDNGIPTLRVHYMSWDGAGWPVLDGPVLEQVPQGTIGHWDFEDGTAGAFMNDTGLTGQVGTVDISGNGHDMYAWDDVAGPSFSAEGQTPTGVGLSSRHNGGQDGYTIGSYINRWSPASWTIEAAVKLDNLSGWQTFIGRDHSAQGEVEADFYFQKSDINNTFRINFDTVGGQRYALMSDFSAQSNQWYYLAATSDGSILTMYADKLDGNGYAIVGTLVLNSANDNALAFVGHSWTFGRGWFNGAFTDHITGNLDDIRFSDTALSPTKLLNYDNALTITETGGSTEVSEEGPSNDTIYVALNHHTTWPALSADVTIMLTTDGQVTVDPAVLVFNSDNWQTAQPVTITAVDDGALEGQPHTGLIQFAVSSADTRYQDAPTKDFSVLILDNECGAWGFLESDFDFNCRVDLQDFAMFASDWAGQIDSVEQFAQQWLGTTMPYTDGAVQGAISSAP